MQYALKVGDLKHILSAYPDTMTLVGIRLADCGCDDTLTGVGLQVDETEEGRLLLWHADDLGKHIPS